MLVIGIDPGITGSICFFKDGKIIDLIEKGEKKKMWKFKKQPKKEEPAPKPQQKKQKPTANIKRDNSVLSRIKR